MAVCLFLCCPVSLPIYVITCLSPVFYLLLFPSLFQSVFLPSVVSVPFFCVYLVISLFVLCLSLCVTSCVPACHTTTLKDIESVSLYVSHSSIICVCLSVPAFLSVIPSFKPTHKLFSYCSVYSHPFFLPLWSEQFICVSEVLLWFSSHTETYGPAGKPFILIFVGN